MTRNNGIVLSGSLWLLILSQSAFSAGVNDNRDKLDDDPTKVTTKVGASWSDTYDMSDSKATFKGNTLWKEGKITSKNHGRIVVLPYIKESGEYVHGHKKMLQMMVKLYLGIKTSMLSFLSKY